VLEAKYRPEGVVRLEIATSYYTNEH
jgi:hypothetical protein